MHVDRAHSPSSHTLYEGETLKRTTLYVGSLTLILSAWEPTLMAGDWGRVQKDFHTSSEMKPGGRLEIENQNGSVEVIGWDRPTLDVSATKYASNEDQLNAIKIVVVADDKGAGALIKTEFPDRSWGFGGNYGVKYVIHVPRKTKLDSAQTTNGSVTVEDLEGGGHAKSTNGHLQITRVTGDYLLETTNGSISIEDAKGYERAATTNGAINGRLAAGSFQAQTTNGSIDLTVSRPGQGRPIRASTTNSSINIALAEFHDNAITAETTHGSLVLRLPQTLNARVNAETSLSGISNDLPLSTTDESSKTHLRGQWGKGGAPISATTSMGSIHFERY